MPRRPLLLARRIPPGARQSARAPESGRPLLRAALHVRTPGVRAAVGRAPTASLCTRNQGYRIAVARDIAQGECSQLRRMAYAPVRAGSESAHPPGARFISPAFTSATSCESLCLASPESRRVSSAWKSSFSVAGEPGAPPALRHENAARLAHIQNRHPEDGGAVVGLRRGPRWPRSPDFLGGRPPAADHPAELGGRACGGGAPVIGGGGVCVGTGRTAVEPSESQKARADPRGLMSAASLLVRRSVIRTST